MIMFRLLLATNLSVRQTHLIEYSWYRRMAQFQLRESQRTHSNEGAALQAGPLTLGNGMADVVNDASHSSESEQTPLINGKRVSYHSMPSPSPFKYPWEDSNTRPSEQTRLLVAISYASFSGILSGMCLIFAKSSVELLLLTINGNNQFWRWEAWMLVFGLVVFALLQLWYLHKALILADPTLVCPC
jgi:magnesium transporter